MFGADAVRCVRRSNGGGGGSIVPDYTTFTEYDPGGYITVNSPSKVSAINMRRNVDSYIYKDYGIDFFGNLTAEFTIDITGFRTSSTGLPLVRCMVFANQVDDGANIDDQVAVTIYYNNSPDKIELTAEHYDGGTRYYETADTPAAGDVYFCKLVLTETDFSVYLAFSDSDRTAENWAYSTTISVTNPVNYRYFYPISSVNVSNNGTASMSLYDVTINNGV